MEPHDIPDDLTVAQLLGRWPQAAVVFVRRGMACVGCAMAPFETLSEVAAAYGHELTGFLSELERSAGTELPKIQAPDVTAGPRGQRPARR